MQTIAKHLRTLNAGAYIPSVPCTVPTETRILNEGCMSLLSRISCLVPLDIISKLPTRAYRRRSPIKTQVQG